MGDPGGESRSLPRWWRVENDHGDLPTVSVAYETVRGTWWEWWPDTQLLHPTHWLGAARRNPGELIGQGYRFHPIEPDEVRALLAPTTGRYGAEHDDLVVARYEERDDGHTLDPWVILDAAGLAGRAATPVAASAPEDTGRSFAAYLAGLTPQQLDLEEIVSEKLRCDPGDGAMVMKILQGMLSRLRQGDRVGVPGASTRDEAVCVVRRVLRDAENQ
jgi:hypothetical protein